MNTAYGIRIYEPNTYYICWKQNYYYFLINQYRIFTLDGVMNYEAVANANYTDQITLIRDQTLYIQTESSIKNLPSERIQVQTEGRLLKM